MINPENQALYFLVSLIFNLYIWIVILRILLQWVRADYYNPLSQLSLKLTDKPLRPLKKLIPMIKNIDVAAIVFLAIVVLIKWILIGLIFSYRPTLAGAVFLLVGDILHQLCNLYFYMLIIVVLASWFMQSHHNPIIAGLQQLTEPVLSRVRRVIPPVSGFDFSPIVVIIVIKLIDILLIFPLLHLAGM